MGFVLDLCAVGRGGDVGALAMKTWVVVTGQKRRGQLGWIAGELRGRGDGVTKAFVRFTRADGGADDVASIAIVNLREATPLERLIGE